MNDLWYSYLQYYETLNLDKDVFNLLQLDVPALVLLLDLFNTPVQGQGVPAIHLNCAIYNQ